VQPRATSGRAWAESWAEAGQQLRFIMATASIPHLPSLLSMLETRPAFLNGELHTPLPVSL
jgi:hypothetical protein